MRKGRPSDKEKNLIYAGSKFNKLASETALKLQMNKSALVRKKLDKPVDEMAVRAERFDKYFDNVSDYAYDFFGVNFWQKQKEIADALKHKNFVCVRSAHSTGKSYLLGILINFYFDTVYPLIGIGTAPTKALVSSVMFSYARQFRNQNLKILGDYWAGPVTPKLTTSEGHYFEGIVTSDPTSVQGRHGENVVLLLDEAVGISSEMFESLESLMVGDYVKVLAIYNPTDPSAYVAQLEKSSGWHTITMSAYDHPNVWTGVERLAEGRKATDTLPFPGAINLSRFEQLLKQWSFRIDKSDYNPARDIILPSSMLAKDLEYYRPGPIASARLLGRWPETSMNAIFTDFVVDNAMYNILKTEFDEPITIGVDVARFGSDFSAFCVRQGGKILELFEINGLETVAVTGKAIELCRKYSERFEVPAQAIDIAVDVIGLGAGVYDNLIDAGYNAYEVNVSERAWNAESYGNLRSELWFEVYNMFLSGQISLGNINSTTIFDLKKQLVAPLFTYDRVGRRQIEPKDDTKKRLERSPDLADAVMLAFAVNTEFTTGITGTRE
jgi:phage terminase large subunit